MVVEPRGKREFVLVGIAELEHLGLQLDDPALVDGPDEVAFATPFAFAAAVSKATAVSKTTAIPETTAALPSARRM